MNDKARNGSRPRHLNARFDEDLAQLKNRVLAMAQVVEAQVGASVDAFVRHDTALAQAVVAGDEQVNQLEREIDERCVQLLALQQPAASDLRFVAAVLKIVTDLERIGDLAVNIARSEQTLSAPPPVVARELPPLAGAALELLRGAVAAFLERSAAKAEAKLTADVPVKALARVLLVALRDVIRKEPLRLDDALSAWLVVRHVERMAEHATNIAEMAVYTERGQDVRHVGVTR